MAGSEPDAHRPRRARPEPSAEPPAARRRRTGLLIAVRAAVVIAAVVAGYLVLGRGRGMPAPPSTATASAAPPVTLISDRSMMTPTAAALIVRGNWEVVADQPAQGTHAPIPACLADETPDAPAPSRAMVRTLTSGPGGPSVLHLARGYRSPELAAEAFGLVSRALGGCNLKGSYLAEGRTISGLGDQATAVVLENPTEHRWRSLVADRTGRVVNVVDVSAVRHPVDVGRVAAALGRVTDSQCPVAVGLCASAPRIQPGPPAASGDQPGFLTAADLPQPRIGTGIWGALDPGSPAEVVTSGCENVSFSKLPAAKRTARSFILVDAPKGMPRTFGLDEIVLTMASRSKAADQADRIAANLRGCAKRLPTATVSTLQKVSGVGADGVPVSGWVGTVDQKISKTVTSRYRIGLVTAGNALVYTFLPRNGAWDLTDGQWSAVTVRAGARTTQLR